MGLTGGIKSRTIAYCSKTVSKFQNAQFELKFGTKANLGTQNPNMDEIFENLKKGGGATPKMGHLPLKMWQNMRYPV